MTSRRAALALIVLATGCAKYPVVLQPPARADLYVLLADTGGTVGTLVVSSEGKEHTLNSANAAVKVPRPGVFETAAVTDAERQSIFGAALAALPPRPTSYVLYFLLDSEELTAESRAIVEQILGEITTRPAPEIIVIGHTDTKGTDEYNDRLSLQRAQRVRSLLVDRFRERRLKTGEIETSGRGKRELLFPTADQVEEPRNRRVEIVVR